MAARRQQTSRTGTLLALVGIAGVLALTFMAGMWTGLNWPVLVATVKGTPMKAVGAADSARRGVERGKPAEPLPALTFYDELKAPLTAPPPAPKATRPSKATEPPRRDETVEADAAPPADAPARFTVQVAAYNARPPAEALQATLAAVGHDVHVVEAATPGGVRYRVQVGAFPTRQAAQDAAAKLSTDRALQAFVTTR
jgi:cell division protein FtsN